ncbi:Hypothetical protein SRAE_1000316800 [Strongyloides ratti]|uniref:Uncharacterized protein n=1 Tax=Strongyloides ratti TaxID=34506 RepID=A0A090LBK8_STRRB|nr:Hypothetical protein SRAE_1000316800 [Strongyloides ratti]CEF64915.1 Hypothetical protein SRAE_1000316800 [Strongyloides ratti]
MNKKITKKNTLKDTISKKKKCKNSGDNNQVQRQINNEYILNELYTCIEKTDEDLDKTSTNDSNKNSNIFKNKVLSKKNSIKNDIDKKTKSEHKNNLVNDSCIDNMAKTSEHMIEIETVNDVSKDQTIGNKSIHKNSLRRRQKTYPTLEDVLSSERNTNVITTESLKNHKKKLEKNENCKNENNKNFIDENIHTKEVDYTMMDECTNKKSTVGYKTSSISQMTDEHKIEKTIY